MEDTHHLGHHLWNLLTKPKSKACDEETEVESSRIDTRFHNNYEGVEAEEEEDDNIKYEKTVAIDARFRNDCLGKSAMADYSFIEVPNQGFGTHTAHAHTGYPHIEVHQHMISYSCNAQGLPPDSYTEDRNGEDYGPFVEATEEGNWNKMKEFLNSHPQALAAPLFRKGGTALHHSLRWGEDREEIAACLVERMSRDDLEIKDADGYTALARAARYHHPKWLLQRMIDKNSNLPNIGEVYRLPLAVASWQGFKDTTRFLYGVTHKNILSPEYAHGIVGVNLLHACIKATLFDIASELVEKFPKILLQPYIFDEESTYPIHTFATRFSTFSDKKSTGGLSKKSIFIDNMLKYICHLLVWRMEDEYTLHDGEESDDIESAREFLRLVCRHLSNFNINMLTKCVSGAMVEAAKHGNIEFITEMLRVDSELITAEKDGKDMFWHAVANRQEKVFNLIYGVGDHKDSLLSHVNKDKNNILHCVAMLPHLSILDRILSPPLQMQRELQWFKEVSNVAKTWYRGNLNKDKLTPRQLFTEQHKELVDWAEASMKDTAKAATTIGALIITTMFAAAFAVTSTNSHIISTSSLTTEALFNVFIVCDALSLCSSTAAILVFLEILTSHYSEEDFLFRLPRKFMLGFYTLFMAIATMMTAFCSALAIALQGRVLLIMFLVLVFLFVPAMFAMSSIFPLLRVTCNSTYGPSIFDKSTKLPKSKRRRVECCY